MRRNVTCFERYQGLLGRYLTHPWGSRARATVGAQLGKLEDSLIRSSATFRDKSGSVKLYRPGIISAEEVRANATKEGLELLYELGTPEIPRVRDIIKVIPIREWKDALEQKKKDDALNAGLVKFTLYQNGYGSCGSEGIAGATMAVVEKQGNSVVEPLNAFALYGLVNGGYDRGSSLSDNIAAAKKYGIPSERVWPRSHSWRDRLSDEAKNDALRHRPIEVLRVSDKEEFGTMLLGANFLYAGYSGHAWFGVDLVDDMRFTYKNSWGASWGDNGFGTLRFSSIQWSYGVWAILTARRGS